jgi:serine/threonine protein kinase
MSYVKPFILGDYLFVELLSTTPPCVIHRTVLLTEDAFSFFRVFKNVNPGLGDARRHSRELELEAETLGDVDHPRVPELCDLGDVGGHAYLAYRYVWGKSLLHLLRSLKAHRKMLSEEHAVYIALELVRVLNAVHAVRSERFPNGVLHASLNPRDIIISHSGEVHLVNLGRRPPALQGQDLDALEFRNLSYLAPEQVNRGTLTQRADLFSAGAIFYEMLTGAPPFMEKSAAKVLNRIARCSFQAPAHVNPALPRELDRFLVKALSAYPNDRFASAGEMASELERHLRLRHASFHPSKIRAMMRNLYRADISEDVGFFQRLESEVERQHRPLVRGIAPALLASLEDAPVLPPRHLEPPDLPTFHTNPGEPSVRGTVTFTFNEFQRQLETRGAAPSFFEVEDTILVPALREPNIIPVHPADPRSGRRFSTREMSAFESTEVPAVDASAPVELSITMEPFGEDEDGDGDLDGDAGFDGEQGPAGKGRTSVYEFGDLSATPFWKTKPAVEPEPAPSPAAVTQTAPETQTAPTPERTVPSLEDEVDAQLFACSRPLAQTDLPLAATVERPAAQAAAVLAAAVKDPAFAPPPATTAAVRTPPAAAGTPPSGSEPGAGIVPARDERETLIGRALGEYVVTGVLGWGGMGTVYEGIQPTIGKEVAIKVLDPSFSGNAHMAQRFLAEARAVNSIRNPNIIDIFSFGILEERYHYFVMEKLNGVTLGSFIQQHERVSMAVGHEILMQVLSAVAAAHQKGIIHRDLKPDNIYLERRPFFDHYVKILDFGIAKFNVDGFKTSVTNAGVPIGTPRYMSPEQCKGLAVTEASDLYMLGIILYEMFTGSLPFQKDSYIDMLIAHLNEPPPRPSTRCELDPELEEIILWTLEKDPNRRPGSALVLGERLLPCLKRLS